MKVEVSDYTEGSIYHSPETPGYSSWCTLWRASNGHLRVAFQQVTGPVDQPDLRRNSTIIIDSGDEAESWQLWDDIPPRPNIKPRESGIYAGAEDTAFCGHGLISLPDGTLVAGLWAGGGLQSGCVQRSDDDGKTWSDPIFVMDPAKYKVYPTIFRQLRDGRLILFAGVWDRECRECGDLEPRTIIKTMFVSEDQGKTWGPPLTVVAKEQGVCEESDFCELPGGDLFFVHRAEHYNVPPGEPLPWGAAPAGDVPNCYSDRLQSMVRRQGAGWRAEPAEPAPFLHSGFPELLLTSQGVILHVATHAIAWTGDVGAHWQDLSIPGSPYYPRAMELRDGSILVVGHDGNDDVYGSADQYIRQQKFRLNVSA